MKQFIAVVMLVVMGFASQASAQAQDDDFLQEDLDRMLAPVALYPDDMLAQILMAATYPLDVVEAARFMDENQTLRGEDLAQAMAGEPFDSSVKYLAQFPMVLQMMDEQLDWTRDLGSAFLSQQDQVMDTVQFLRRKALDAGTLRSNDRQRVAVADGIITIESIDPEVVYVPSYNPEVVYGGWWWPDRPDYWEPPPRYRTSDYDNVIAGGIFFGLGFGVIESFHHHARPDWHRHHVVIDDRDHHGRRDDGHGGGAAPAAPPTVWQHDPSRGGADPRPSRSRGWRTTAPSGTAHPPAPSGPGDADRPPSGHARAPAGPDAGQSQPGRRLPEIVRPPAPQIPAPDQRVGPSSPLPGSHQRAGASPYQSTSPDRQRAPESALPPPVPRPPTTFAPPSRGDWPQGRHQTEPTRTMPRTAPDDDARGQYQPRRGDRDGGRRAAPVPDDGTSAPGPK